jgi:hypothetical protein
MKMPRLGWEDPPPRAPLSLQFVENFLAIYGWHKRPRLWEVLGLDVEERTQHIYFGPLECAAWIYQEDSGSLVLATFTSPPLDLDDEGGETLELTKATMMDIPELLGKAVAYKATQQ